MLRALDNLGTGPSQPSTALPYGVFNRGVTTMATGATRSTNLMGPAMRSLDNLVLGNISLPGQGNYGNAPQTYLSNVAINYNQYGTSLKGIASLPGPGTMVWTMQDHASERTERVSLGTHVHNTYMPNAAYGSVLHNAYYPGMSNGMNKKANPMSTPEGLNYHLLTRQLEQFLDNRKNGIEHTSMSPTEVADTFSLDGICISSMTSLNHSSQAMTFQGRANYINNLGVTELPRAAKIYTVFKRTKKAKIPKAFCLSPYMNAAERSRTHKNVPGTIETVGDEFTPVLAYPVVLADGSRLSSDYLVDEFNNADNAAFYLGHVFYNEDYNQFRSFGYGKTTDPKTMKPFSDAGNSNDRGLLQINVELKRVR